MSKFASQIPSFFLILLLSCKCDARNPRVFFSKYINLAETKNLATSQISATPTSAPAPSPAPVDYGFAPAPSPESGDFYTWDGDNKDIDSNEKEYRSNSFSNTDNAFWTSNYRSYGSGPQGMRLTGNDEYYYNGRSYYKPTDNVREGYYYGDRQKSGRSYYKPTDNVREGYYYGDRQKSRYEFDSMEEYERQEGGYPDFQQDQFYP